MVDFCPDQTDYTPSVMAGCRILLVILSLGCACAAVANDESIQCPQSTKKLKPIYILTVLPIPTNGEHVTSARRTYNFIAGALIAQQDINRKKNLLPGYHLELIVESTGPVCIFNNVLRLTSTGLDTVVKYAVNPPCSPLVAVNGLTCNLQTSYISYVAAKCRLDLIHFTSTRLRSFDEEVVLTRLWRIVDSGTVFANAVISIMDKFNWTKISIVYSQRHRFLSIAALRFRKLALSSGSKEIIFTVSIEGRYRAREKKFGEVVQNMKKRAGRVLLIALTRRHTAEFLCKLEEKGLVYPAFTMIHLDKIPKYLLKKPACNKTNLIKVHQGHIYLQIPTNTIENSQILVSGSSYRAYKQKVKSELKKVSSFYGANMTYGLRRWASISHDEIWALALAINNSLPILKSKTSPLTATPLENMKPLQSLWKN